MQGPNCTSFARFDGHGRTEQQRAAMESMPRLAAQSLTVLPVLTWSLGALSTHDSGWASL
jgi:hypothetical protein